MVLFAVGATFAQLPLNQDFETSLTNGGWTAVSVTGALTWTLDETHGVDGSNCGKATGYTGTSGVYEINELWYISPVFNADNYTTLNLNFMSAQGYSGSTIGVFYSTDYNGTTPATATWTALTATWAPADPFWTWTASGNVDLSAVNGATCYVGFKFANPATTASSTWELDNITITAGTSNIENVSAQLSVYPNPVQNVLNISEKANVKVINIAGQVVIDAQNVNSVDMSALTTGMYIVRIENEAGVQTEKIMKN